MIDQDGHRIDAAEYIRRVSVTDAIKAAKDADPEGKHPLHDELLRASPNEDVISELIKHHPVRVSACNSSGSNALHVACTVINTLDTGIMLFLIEANKDCLKVKNNFGLLPVHKAVVAAANDNAIKHLRMLLEYYPAGLNEPNIERQYPLHLCISQPKEVFMDCVRIVATKYPKVAEKQDKYGQLPIHKACARPRVDPELIELLLRLNSAGASVKDATSGWLPLHWMLHRPEPDFESLYDLLDAHPRAVNVRDARGRKPVDVYLALDKTSSEVVRYIGKIQQKIREEVAKDKSERKKPANGSQSKKSQRETTYF